MKQVVQSLSGGPVRLVDVPRPTIDPTQVLVRTQASLISAGTERAVTALAQSSLLAKARARPDLVRKVVSKARADGLSEAVRTVRTRLDEDLPLGYSAAGIVLEVGDAVSGIVPGQLVATGGAGRANHAEYQAVSGMLCAVAPDGMAASDAAFATVAAIPLHGLRLATVDVGAKVVVVGLGLLGQLAIRLAQAAGCDVAGIDVSDFAIERARAAGAFAVGEAGDATTAAIMEWSRGRGADAVLVTAATKASDLMRRVPDLCRDRAAVVVVGDVGLDLERTPYYEKELDLRFARSYGPGRYETTYEDWAVDYPPGFVRWTEGRNLEAVLDLLASGRLQVADLVTHRFDITDAVRAYDLIERRSEPYLGVALDYGGNDTDDASIVFRPPAEAADERRGIGLIGAGAFASTVLVPAFRAAGLDRLVSVTSASGLSAARMAERAGFERAVSGADAVVDDPAVGVVVVATPHDTHAALATKALRAGKHVFCEKPLALTSEELDEVEVAWRGSGATLFVGFNRRWSPAVALVHEHLDAAGSGPLVVSYRVNAGTLPAEHWYHDRRQGGRLLGEVCHFVDTCSAIVGHDPLRAQAVVCADGLAERALQADLVVQLEYVGAVASIVYATGGPPSLAKERIEVLGRGTHAVIDDFRTVELGGRSVALKHQDKGHRRQVEEFRRALDGPPSAVGIGSMRATLEAAASLSTAR